MQLRILLIFSACCFISNTYAIDSDSAFTLYLVRHAEKQLNGSRDPALTKADNLIGNLAGTDLPRVQNECDIKITLLKKVLGAEEEIPITPLIPGEPLLLVAGTSLTAGIIKKINKKSIVHFELRRPLCAEKGSTVAVSRSIKSRYRLIGYGELVT